MAKLLTLNQAARFLGCSPASLATPPWRRRHKILAVRIGRRLRFDTATLAEVVEARREDRIKSGAGTGARRPA